MPVLPDESARRSPSGFWWLTSQRKPLATTSLWRPDRCVWPAPRKGSSASDVAAESLRTPPSSRQRPSGCCCWAIQRSPRATAASVSVVPPSCLINSTRTRGSRAAMATLAAVRSSDLQFQPLQVGQIGVGRVDQPQFASVLIRPNHGLAGLAVLQVDLLRHGQVELHLLGRIGDFLLAGLAQIRADDGVQSNVLEVLVPWRNQQGQDHQHDQVDQQAGEPGGTVFQELQQPRAGVRCRASLRRGSLCVAATRLGGRSPPPRSASRPDWPGSERAWARHAD